MVNKLECIGSPYYMGPEEARAFTVDFEDVGVTTAASSEVKAYDMTQGDSDVSTTVLSGASTEATSIVTTDLVSSLTAGHTYRIDVYCEEGSNKYERFIVVICPRRSGVA